MSTTFAKPDTLIGTALAPLDWTRSVGLVFSFSLLMALSAQILIPIGPVPITGQTFVVLLTGALLGSRLGAMAMIVYLMEGASGLPFISGAFAEHDWDRRFLTAVAAMAIGSVVIMLSGWTWFALVTNTPLTVAFQLTVLKFIPGDIIKIVLAAAVLPAGWALLKRKASQKQ